MIIIIIADEVHSLTLLVYQLLCLVHACQLSRFYRECPSFSSNLPVSWLEEKISREIPTAWPFSKVYHLFRYFRHVKKENKTRSGFGVLI